MQRPNFGALKSVATTQYFDWEGLSRRENLWFCELWIILRFLWCLDISKRFKTSQEAGSCKNKLRNFPTELLLQHNQSTGARLQCSPDCQMCGRRDRRACSNVPSPDSHLWFSWGRWTCPWRLLLKNIRIKISKKQIRMRKKIGSLVHVVDSFLFSQTVRAPEPLNGSSLLGQSCGKPKNSFVVASRLETSEKTKTCMDKCGWSANQCYTCRSHFHWTSAPGIVLQKVIHQVVKYLRATTVPQHEPLMQDGNIESLAALSSVPDWHVQWPQQ